MSTPMRVPSRRRGTARRVAAVLTALLGAAAVGYGGSMLSAESATYRTQGAPLVGRTSTVCTVAPSPESQTTVTAVAVSRAPGRAGLLTGSVVGRAEEQLRLTEQGRGTRLRQPAAPVILRGEGVMATAASGAVVSVGTGGESAGLAAAACTPPATSHWFVGVGAGESHRSEIIVTNPDDSDAEVDLRYFGRSGPVVVPGSPGVVVGARSSRTIALAPLVRVEGPLSVWVRATEGRVSAVARDLDSDDLEPTGVDWHPASVPPASTLVVPAVPEGEGRRELVVVNPGRQRATVTVAVLGISGEYSPVGAETLEVPPESSASIPLDRGLVGQTGAIRLSADVPVSAAVLSTSSRDDAQPDLAVQPALPAVAQVGASAVATIEGGDSELVVSNAADSDAQLSFAVVSLTGVTQREGDILLGGHSTATRRLNADSPSFVVLRVPAGSAVHGGVVLSQPEGPVAGLSTLAIGSPDVASRAPMIRADPAVGR